MYMKKKEKHWPLYQGWVRLHGKAEMLLWNDEIKCNAGWTFGVIQLSIIFHPW